MVSDLQGGMGGAVCNPDAKGVVLSLFFVNRIPSEYFMIMVRC